MLPRTPKLTCEMAHLELFRRHTARVTSTHLGRLKSGEFDPAYSVTLAQRAAAAAPALAFGDATHAWAPPDWLQQSVAVVKGDASHVLVVVDSVHSWAEAAPTDVDEYTALNDGLAAAPSNRSQCMARSLYSRSIVEKTKAPTAVQRCFAAVQRGVDVPETIDSSTDRPVLTLADLENFDPTASAHGRERRFCCPLPAPLLAKHVQLCVQSGLAPLLDWPTRRAPRYACSSSSFRSCLYL